MFTKILIANRGEIAVRIMQTAKRMGIKTVAVYSEADTNSLHVQEADEAVFIGPSPSSESYLVMDKIIQAALATGAQAIHPGYGFLSENSRFADKATRAGLTFIGPKTDAIRVMGDKIRAKQLAKKAGVSTVPGHREAVRDLDKATVIAARIGYPVMIKAAAGGGGKGMRIVHSAKDLEDSLRSAASEAKSSFSDDRVFIEKFIENPRHIEIQIIADGHGNVVALGERECSIQRRHQKVIEEAPSPFLDEKTRKAMQKQSVALAKKVGYMSAGTVEFIVDRDRNFYFLEMNTRLQVEHRVTELITGYDLVELMIKIAAGQRLPFTQSDVKINGWAMEARVYAEDPTRGFMPSTGRLTRFTKPDPIPGLIVDTGVYEGSDVSMFYDPMIAKVCTYNQTRAQTIADMQTALSSFIIRGIAHNISFLEAIISNPRFASGDISTHFIADEYPEGFSGAELNSTGSKVFLAVAAYVHLRYQEREREISSQLRGRKPMLGSQWVIRLGEEDFSAQITPKPGGYDVMLNNETITVRSGWELGKSLLQGSVNDQPVNVHVKRLAEGYLLTHAGASTVVKVRTPTVALHAVFMPQAESQGSQKELQAPITGLVLDFHVKEGDKVTPGAKLLTLEAMKMENILIAEVEAVVRKIHVAPRSSVTAGQMLIEFE
jgi:propionyl-CoA carboxylase alpha chain